MKTCGNLGVIKGFKILALSAKFYTCRCYFLNLGGLNLAAAFSFCFGLNFSLPGGGKFKKSLRFIKYGYETKFDHKFCSFRSSRFRRFAINLNSKSSLQI